MSELIYDTSKKNHVNHVNKEFTKSLFNCFRFCHTLCTHCTLFTKTLYNTMLPAIWIFRPVIIPSPHRRAHKFLHLTLTSGCVGRKVCVVALLQSEEVTRLVNLRGGLGARLSLGRTPWSKLKADMFGVHSLSYYCSILIYKSVWDMEISHATQDIGWVEAHCETGPSALWGGLICKLMLSLHLERAIYSAFSSFQHVILSREQ